ncbi:hypothetical protein [Mycoplasma testudineum]|uniref:hypothetical protein n=1 Tax=Mycoplasma testudineum TaxID=244584 RepID=UPI000B93E911|nr:hypothetical protein [Mycoplasma testudineum]OYD27096.1 hypothetical protein CG473_00420 [Mycoplasma testudineum]
MLNNSEPIQVYEHKINMVAHYKVNTKVTPTERHDVEIKRYLRDDTFSVKTTFYSTRKRNIVFALQINNKNIAQSSNFYLEPGDNKTHIFDAIHIKHKLTEVDNLKVVVIDYSNQRLSDFLFITDLNISLSDYKRQYLIDNKTLLVKIPHIINISNWASQIHKGVLPTIETQYLNLEL